VLLAFKDRTIVLIGGDWHPAAKLCHIFRHFLAHESLSYLALLEEIDLLHQKPILDVHKLIQT